MRSTIVGILAAALLAAAGYLMITTPWQQGGEVVLELTGDRSVELEAGRELVVELDENPTTGYIWKYVISPKGIVVPAGSDFSRDEAPAGMVGVGGTRVFRFKAAYAGEVSITFSESRPWEEGIPPVREFTLKARVK